MGAAEREIAPFLLPVDPDPALPVRKLDAEDVALPLRDIDHPGVPRLAQEMPGRSGEERDVDLPVTGGGILVAQVPVAVMQRADERRVESDRLSVPLRLQAPRDGDHPPVVRLVCEGEGPKP